MKHALLFFSFLLISITSYAQNPTIAICSGSQYICALTNNQEICVEIKIDPSNPNWQKFEIDWGDATGKTTVLGNTPQPIQIKHTYNLSNFYNTCSEIKEYNVKLLSYKATGIPANNAFFFNFKNKPIATFSAPTPICKDKLVIFKIYDPNNPNSFVSCPPFQNTWTIKWDYGDGSPIDDKGLHTYKQKGTYTIKLTTENECGIAFSQQIVTTYGDPLAKIIPDSGFVTPLTNPLKICLGGGGLVKFDGTMSDNTSNYLWEMTPTFGWAFDKNTNKNSPKPYFKFTQPGNYILKLTVNNECNKPNSVTKNITVIADENLQLSPQSTGECNSLSYTPIPYNSKAMYYINNVLKTSFPVLLPVGQYNIKAVLENDCGKQEKTDNFEVVSPQAVKIISPSKDTTICINTGNLPLKADIAGGFFTVNNGGTIVQNKAFSTTKAGVFTITYTRGTGKCEQKSIISVNVVDEKLELPKQADTCLEIKNYIPLRYNPKIKATYTINGKLSTFPMNLGIGTYIIEAKLNNACGNQIYSDTFEILAPKPVKITFPSKDTTICIGTKLQLKASLSNVKFTGTNVTGNIFDPKKAATYQIVCTSGVGQCEQADQLNITVIEDVKLQLPSQSDFCEKLNYMPQKYNKDAVYTINDTVVKVFPTLLLGNTKIYKIKATLVGKCLTQVLEDSFFVLNPFKIKINPLPSKVCKSSSDITLKSNYNNTTWFVNGVKTSIFSLKNVKIGKNSIIANDNTGCAYADTTYIEMIDDAVKINAINDFCYNTAPSILKTTPLFNGNWSGKGINTNGLFSPKAAGNGVQKINFSYLIPNSNCIAQDSVNVTVNQPLVSIDVSNCDNTLLTFSTDFKNIDKVETDFGDGQKSNAQTKSIVHNFPKAGKYTIIVKGTLGTCDTIFKKDIVIEEKAIAAFTIPDSICENVKIPVQNLSAGTKLTYEWKAGNTIVDTTKTGPKNLSFSVLKDSVLTITLDIFNGCGKSSFSKTLKIKAIPKANMATVLPKYCSGEKIWLQNTSTLATDFNWKKDNVFLSSVKQIDTLILFTDKTETTYTYKLTASNICGSDSIVQKIVIKPTDVSS